MTIEEIDAIILDEETLTIVVQRMFDLSIIPAGETAYTIDIDEDMIFFDRVYFNKRLNAPKLERFEKELEEYKQELRQVEYERLAEIAKAEFEAEKIRRDAFVARIKALDFRAVLDELGEGVPNTAFKRKDLLSLPEDEIELQRLEAAQTVVDARKTQEATEKQIKEVSAKVMDICNECTRIAIAYNLVNELDPTKKDEQASTYNQAVEALRQWRPAKFKSIILAMAPNDVLAPVALRDKLIAYLESEGL